jgi:hypothetical protein
MTWVWKYNEESRLQIGASFQSFVTPDKIHHSPRPWSAQSPVLLYGSETWVLTKREENQLLVYERKVHRMICGPKIENGVYRSRRYNHECDKEFNTQNALTVMKISRLHYAGHMIRRPEDLPLKVLFRAKPNGNPGGRVRDWTHCAQDRQSWKDLLQQAFTRYWL